MQPMEQRSVNGFNNGKEKQGVNTMADRNATQRRRYVGDDDIDDPKLPDEIDDEGENGNSNGRTATYEGDELSLDDLKGLKADHSRDEAEHKRMMLPHGDWIKEDRWEYKVKINRDDSQPGDYFPTGRLMVSVWGLPKPRYANDTTYEPTLSIYFSPDVRYREGKADLPYQTFLFLRDLYLAINSEKFKEIDQIIDMCINESFIITTNTSKTGGVFIRGFKKIGSK